MRWFIQKISIHGWRRVAAAALTCAQGCHDGACAGHVSRTRQRGQTRRTRPRRVDVSSVRRCPKHDVGAHIIASPSLPPSPRSPASPNPSPIPAIAKLKLFQLLLLLLLRHQFFWVNCYFLYFLLESVILDYFWRFSFEELIGGGGGVLMEGSGKGFEEGPGGWEGRKGEGGRRDRELVPWALGEACLSRSDQLRRRDSWVGLGCGFWGIALDDLLSRNLRPGGCLFVCLCGLRRGMVLKGVVW